MKKKILVPIMALALALTAGINYKTVNNTNTLTSIELSKIIKTAYAITVELDEYNCNQTWWQSLWNSRVYNCVEGTTMSGGQMTFAEAKEEYGDVVYAQFGSLNDSDIVNVIAFEEETICVYVGSGGSTARCRNC